jgi:hypothetical protein
MSIEMESLTVLPVMCSLSQMFQRIGSLKVVMIRPGGKAKTIAVRVMKGKGIKVPTATSQKMKPLTQPYLQH